MILYYYQCLIITCTVFCSRLSFYSALDNDTQSVTNNPNEKITKVYHHISKYSKYKSEGDLRQCNMTFFLLHYPIYDTKKECNGYSSLILGMEELIPFYFAVRETSMPKPEIIFPLRNVAQSGTQFRVILTNYQMDYNMEIEIKKVNLNKENNVVCVKFQCPKAADTRIDCSPVNQTVVVQKPQILERYSDSWFTIALSLMVLVVIVIICILLYLVLCKNNRRSMSSVVENVLDTPKNDMTTCNSFDAYDFLNKTNSQRPCLSETYIKHGQISINPNLSEVTYPAKSSTSMIIFNKQKTIDLNLKSGQLSPKIDHMELLNNKTRTLPLIKKHNSLNNHSNRSTPSPIYSSMGQDVAINNSSRTNPSFRSVKYIPPLKLVENEF